MNQLQILKRRAIVCLILVALSNIIAMIAVPGITRYLFSEQTWLGAVWFGVLWGLFSSFCIIAYELWPIDKWLILMPIMMPINFASVLTAQSVGAEVWAATEDDRLANIAFTNALIKSAEVSLWILISTAIFYAIRRRWIQFKSTG